MLKCLGKDFLLALIPYIVCHTDTYRSYGPVNSYWSLCLREKEAAFYSPCVENKWEYVECLHPFDSNTIIQINHSYYSPYVTVFVDEKNGHLKNFDISIVEVCE